MPPSAADVVLVVSRVEDGAATPCARSYDGHAWEGTLPAPCDVTYAGDACERSWGAHGCPFNGLLIAEKTCACAACVLRNISCGYRQTLRST